MVSLCLLVFLLTHYLTVISAMPPLKVYPLNTISAEEGPNKVIHQDVVFYFYDPNCDGPNCFCSAVLELNQCTKVNCPSDNLQSLFFSEPVSNATMEYKTVFFDNERCINPEDRCTFYGSVGYLKDSGCSGRSYIEVTETDKVYD